MREKPQTPAQRVANPVWLREQIKQLIKSCDENIAEDLRMAERTSGDVSERYGASATSTRHWKRRLQLILEGKTFAEEVAENIERRPRRIFSRKVGSP